MIHLTFEDVKRLSDEAIADKPVGYAYEDAWGNSAHESANCSYVHRLDENGDPTDYASDAFTHTPGCHVGDVLIRAGVPIEWFDNEEGNTSQTVFSHLRTEGILIADDDSMTYLNKFQELQDLGSEWSHCKDEALLYVGK